MTELSPRRRTPFMVVAIVVVIVTLAIFRLPESLVTQIENSGTFSLSQRGWAFRLLAFFAIAQAFYVGFAVLRPEHVKTQRDTNPRVGALTRAALLTSLARTAAGAIVLTLIYGIAAFSATGFRAGFWLFVGLAVAQGAWYFRETGQIGRWLAFQPETRAAAVTEWIAAPADYCPPIARGLRSIEVPTGSDE